MIAHGLRMKLAIHTLLSLGSLAVLGTLNAQKTGGPAKPDVHSFADPKGGREGYDLADHEVNEARLYDFYQRQADFYMASSESLPAILPAYPGLDAGLHGHWGKHNQNNYSDSRWNDIEMGEHLTQVFRHDKTTLLKGISLRLGGNRELSAAFDPLTLSYRAIWEGGFVHFDGYRWGTSRNASLEGKPWFVSEKASMPANSTYLGFHRYGKRIVFHYQIGDVILADEPWATATAFYRRIDLSPTGHLDLPLGNDLPTTIVSSQNVEAAISNGTLSFKSALDGATVIIRQSNDKSPPISHEAIAHLTAERKATRRWTETLKSPGVLGKTRPDSAYVVDTLIVPLKNPYNSVMQLTGIDFFPNGDALVCTLPGDVWLVSGIDDSLKNVTWRRFATGLNQPVGIHIDSDGIFVLDRGQIYRLHDTNNDGEADYYENYANDFGGYNRSHSHTFGLHRTSDGSFHFTQREAILRTGPDRKTVVQGSGVRNCMGIGGSKDYFWVAPQEGTWTPASEIIEVRQGEFYGLPSSADTTDQISPPLCYIPRGVDNSTGGMVEITSDKWGPFKGSHIGLSYGSGIHYLILRDDKAARPQGATVPLEGEFLAGAIRGNFHPVDGQLYLVGLDGWGDYSTQDGCFHRVRYTGKPVYKPSGFQVHSNGVRIDFTQKLAASATELHRYFGQAWNYEYAKRYGSPEFSMKTPGSLGHDPITIRSVTLLNNNESIFVEIPDLNPVMQLHLRMHLTAADGHDFKTDLFPSPMFHSPPFVHDGIILSGQRQETSITLRVNRPTKNPNQKNETGKLIEGGIKLTVDAIGGLLYQQKLLTAKPGQGIALTLRNTDVMPHNLVIVKPGATQKVGEASFKMLNDPKAGEKNYVPALSEVLHVIPVIDPGKKHVLHFSAPTKPGDYPYLCTFPGHWQAMQGILRVE
jgi:azurin